ncbi:MAG TPA: hypothetical protein VHM71_03420, partial [Candidatus Deferrimicrobium sp.]|nr:hypothetical protein [Candidatus Deferrimicrobium sp.]
MVLASGAVYTLRVIPNFMEELMSIDRKALASALTVLLLVGACGGSATQAPAAASPSAAASSAAASPAPAASVAPVASGETTA